MFTGIDKLIITCPFIVSVEEASLLRAGTTNIIIMTIRPDSELRSNHSVPRKTQFIRPSHPRVIIHPG